MSAQDADYERPKGPLSDPRVLWTLIATLGVAFVGTGIWQMLDYEESRRRENQLRSVVQEMCDRWEVEKADDIGPLCEKFNRGDWPKA